MIKAERKDNKHSQFTFLLATEKAALQLWQSMMKLLINIGFSSLVANNPVYFNKHKPTLEKIMNLFLKHVYLRLHLSKLYSKITKQQLRQSVEHLRHCS